MGCELDVQSQKFLRQRRTLELSLRLALKVGQGLWKGDQPKGWDGRPLSRTGEFKRTSQQNLSPFSVSFQCELWERTSHRFWKWEIYCKGENLKLGMGDPWAGHESSNGLPESASRAETVLFRVNLGEDPPTGSVKETLNLNSPI